MKKLFLLLVFLVVLLTGCKSTALSNYSQEQFADMFKGKISESTEMTSFSEKPTNITVWRDGISTETILYQFEEGEALIYRPVPDQYGIVDTVDYKEQEADGTIIYRINDAVVKVYTRVFNGEMVVYILDRFNSNNKIEIMRKVNQKSESNYRTILEEVFEELLTSSDYDKYGIAQKNINGDKIMVSDWGEPYAVWDNY